MRRVRCVSPHGGGRNGLRSLADGGIAECPPGWKGEFRFPPHAGGYMTVPVLGRIVAVGDEVDAPEPPGFIADGYNFADVATGGADVCAGLGEACWCGQHRAFPEGAAPALPPGEGE